MTTERPDWVRDAVIYQIFPDRFARSTHVNKPKRLETWNSAPTVRGYKGGDLRGIAERLDWLTDLGINTIYLNPVFVSPSNHRYHTADYFHVDPLLGGDEAFDDLLSSCHARGVRLVLDGVFNHTGRSFFAFADLVENGTSSPWRDWYHVRGFPLMAFDEKKKPNYKAWWDMHGLPKLDTENPDVREYLMTVAEHWIGRGVDGWRLDVPDEIRTPGFWEEFRDRVKAKNSDAWICGEIWRDALAWIGDGTRFDGVMNYPLGSAIIRFACGGQMDEMVALGVDYLEGGPLDAAGFSREVRAVLDRYPEAAHLSNMVLLSSHDTPRAFTVLKHDVTSAVLAVALQMSMPGAPCIYYGEEIGLEGGRDPECRGAFPWGEENDRQGDLLKAYRDLIALRREHGALRSAEVTPLTANGSVWSVRRGGELVVWVNSGDETGAIDAEIDLSDSSILWSWGDRPLRDEESWSVPPRSAGIARVT